jgi:predicted negative regulator of RcsB-dependent stress response
LINWPPFCARFYKQFISLFAGGLVSYHSEQEQIEIFRKWWQENGRQTLIGAAICLLAYGGWAQWQASQRTSQEQASVLYQQWLEAQDKAGSASSSEAVSRLREEYPKTFYGKAVLLALAQEQVEQGKLNEAESYLRQLVEQDPGESLLWIGRLRLARVLYATEKYDDALSVLNVPVAEGFRAAFAELRGDIFMAQGHAEKASESYQEALDSNEAESDQLGTLQMKLADAKGSIPVN